MNGFIEVLALLLSLGDFGAAPNPKAPTPTEIMKYAPETYDFMVYADLEVVVPKNYKALTKLPDQPAVKSNAKLLEQVRQVLKEIESGRDMAKSVAGFDPVNDIKSITAWAKLEAAGEPRFLIVVRGKLPVETLKPMIAMGASPNMAVGKGDKGELLIGSKAWIGERETGWKPKKHDARAVAVLKRKPIFAATAAVSDAGAGFLKGMFGGSDNVLTDVVAGHSFASFYIAHNGGGWSWVARSKDGFKRAALASDGMIELMRAGHFASRGMARIVLAGIDSYKGDLPGLDQIIARKDDILKAVMAVTGDGKFKATVAKQAGTNTVSVQLSGRTLSEVFPVVGAMTFGGAAAFFLLRGKQSRMVEAPTDSRGAEPKPIDPLGKKLRVRDTYKAARTRHGM